MSAKVGKFKLGLFVIVGVCLGAGAVLWVASSKYLEGGRTYVTFFNESVQGLEKDSVVKYRGVDVGRVLDIRVAPDYKLIEVVMHIKFTGDLSREMLAQLRTVGITGIAFVELDRRKPGEPVSRVPINFAAEHPIIPSRPSEIAEIFSLVDKITNQLRNVDFKAMAEGMAALIKEAGKILRDGRLARAVDEMVSASEGLDKLVREARAKLGQADVKGISNELTAAVSDARAVLADMRSTFKEMGLPEVGKKAGGVMDRADQAVKRADDMVAATRSQVDQTMANVMAVSRNLERASRSLERLLHRLERRPSDIIWGRQKPAQPAK